MESGDQQDKWAALNESLGIEPTTEPEPKQAPPPAEAPRAPAVEHRVPSRPASAWGELAESLGLEVEEPEPPTAAPPEPVAEVATTKEATKGAAKAKVSTESPAEVAAEQESWDVSEADKEDEQVVSEEETELNAGDATTLQDPKIQAEAASTNVEEAPAAPSGFGGTGLTLPDWFPFGGRKKTTPPPEPKVEAEVSEKVPEVAEVEPAADLDAQPQTEDATTESTEDQEGEGERRRGRRRRGRRRGRGRKQEAADESEENSAEEVNDESDSEGEVAESDDSHDSDDSDEESSDKRARTISHKNIPPWQEAIGVVVDANIAARGDRKRSGRSRGSTRGGRGRRRNSGGSKKET